jgi:2OG-Fe(II) oxygenase superfamily
MPYESRHSSLEFYVSTSHEPLFQFKQLQFDYDPYPIGYAKDVFTPSLYDEMTSQYPSQELFQFKAKLGNKYSLSEVNNPEQYHQFIRTNPIWKKVHDEVKRPEFVNQILDVMTKNQVDLGFKDKIDVVNDPAAARKARWRSAFESFRYGAPKKKPIKTRFEFSMLPADGGHIRPHTDGPNKFITLVISCMPENEWPNDFGGGTAVLKAKEPNRIFNHLNKYQEFEETDTLKPFVPNQCVLFVKTFNSLHAVAPMTQTGSKIMRKTLTINIETI